ncbi:28S ribosomal protein S7, mitochondrial-like [Pecten maximus]|uniref:28S ribosomal protein S7, mitochondrial-like n=1 Tax=Pecten maximus TaxID=6579 RepID=UPI001458857E|nr:28S ribosomal protein S7, mitochondrial-like [Pecten maximus]
MTLCKGKFLFQCLVSSHSRLSTFVQVRSKWYTAQYLEPTMDKKELKKPVSATDPRLFRPIMAPRTEQSMSFTYVPEVQKFINIVMRKGNKKLARDLMEETFKKVKILQLQKYQNAKESSRDEIDLNPVSVFLEALENCRPNVHTTRVIRGGVWYEVPIACNPDTQMYKAMTFLIKSAGEKDRTTRFTDVLAKELIDASNNEGKSVKRKQELLKRCDDNKAFSSFRFR